MNSLSKSCATCSVCWSGGVASHPRILGIHSHPTKMSYPVLVIDDCPHEPTMDDWKPSVNSYQDHYWNRITWTRKVLKQLLGDIPFVYTQAIRCEPRVVTDSAINPAVACSVWTHNLTANRKLILTGEIGFNQMKLPVERYVEFTLFKTARLGSVFTIPSIDTLESESIIKECKVRLSKALKEVKLL